MVLLFKGENAVRKVRSVVGHISPERRGGETIRDTFGDYIANEDGSIRYFEPAVLAAPNAAEAEAKLKLWGKYSDADAGLLEDVVPYQPGETGERDHALVIQRRPLKNEAFQKPAFFKMCQAGPTDLRVAQVQGGQLLQFSKRNQAGVANLCSRQIEMT